MASPVTRVTSQKWVVLLDVSSFAEHSHLLQNFRTLSIPKDCRYGTINLTSYRLFDYM